MAKCRFRRNSSTLLEEGCRDGLWSYWVVGMCLFAHFVWLLQEVNFATKFCKTSLTGLLQCTNKWITSSEMLLKFPLRTPSWKYQVLYYLEGLKGTILVPPSFWLPASFFIIIKMWILNHDIVLIFDITDWVFPRIDFGEWGPESDRNSRSREFPWEST